MKAMILPSLARLSEVSAPLQLVDLPIPEPGPGQVLIKVTACGVCHTELDEIEGRTPPPRLPVILGHEVVGRVVQLGPDVTHEFLGQRVGVGWIYCSSGNADENLSPEFCATGRDVNGGYAEYMTAHADYVYTIPDTVHGRTGRAVVVCGRHRLSSAPQTGKHR